MPCVLSSEDCFGKPMGNQLPTGMSVKYRFWNLMFEVRSKRIWIQKLLMFPVFSNPLMFIQLGPVSSFQNLIRSKIQPPRSQRVLVSTSSFPLQEPFRTIQGQMRSQSSLGLWGREKRNSNQHKDVKLRENPKHQQMTPNQWWLLILKLTTRATILLAPVLKVLKLNRLMLKHKRHLVRFGLVQTSMGLCVCVHTPFSVQGSFDWLS